MINLGEDPITDLDHIAIAVKDLAQAMKKFCWLGTPGQHEVIAEQGVEVQIINVAHTRLELLKPLWEDSPVGRFLAKRGEGIHHIAFEVQDIKQAMRECESNGIKLLSHEPKVGAEGRLICFLDPTSTGGVLIELTQKREKNEP